jgi:hypothetical protein
MIIHGTIKKSKQKLAPKKVREEYQQWLDKVNKPVPRFSHYSFSSKSVKTFNTPKAFVRETPYYPSLNSADTGSAPKALPKVYTGDKVVGIATLHKSNAVPVFNSTEAVEISSMRR